MNEMKPENQRVKLDKIKPHHRNYNRHPEHQVARIALSLKKFGQVRSIVVWKNTILAGHGVVEAARSLGWRDIAADVLPEDYPEHLALAYVAADNELSRLSDPDQAALAAILEESMTTDDELLQAIGYNEAELERLLEELDQSTLEETFGSKTNYGVGKKTEKQIRVVISMSSVSTLESAILATGQRERGVAIMDICQFYLENKPTDEKR